MFAGTHDSKMAKLQRPLALQKEQIEEANNATTAKFEKEDSFLFSPKNNMTTAAKNVINNAIMIILL
jgi:hypothetical protein